MFEDLIEPELIRPCRYCKKIMQVKKTAQEKIRAYGYDPHKVEYTCDECIKERSLKIEPEEI